MCDVNEKQPLFINVRKVRVDHYLSPEAENYLSERGSEFVWQGDDE